MSVALLQSPITGGAISAYLGSVAIPNTDASGNEYLLNVTCAPAAARLQVVAPTPAVQGAGDIVLGTCSGAYVQITDATASVGVNCIPSATLDVANPEGSGQAPSIALHQTDASGTQSLALYAVGINTEGFGAQHPGSIGAYVYPKEGTAAENVRLAYTLPTCDDYEGPLGTANLGDVILNHDVQCVGTLNAAALQVNGVPVVVGQAAPTVMNIPLLPITGTTSASLPWTPDASGTYLVNFTLYIGASSSLAFVSGTDAVTLSLGNAIHCFSALQAGVSGLQVVNASCVAIYDAGAAQTLTVTVSNASGTISWSPSLSSARASIVRLC